MAKTVNGKTTHFVYGLNGQLLYEHDTQTNRRTQYITLNGQPIALIRNNTPYWVHTDHLGRPELLASQTKTIAWRARLTAFNHSVVTDTIGGYHLGFSGQYHDEETGFAYNIHRDYDPATGRYLQSDPIGVDGGINTYAYAMNDPVSLVDPLGLEGVGYWNNGGSRESLSKCQQAALLDSTLNLIPFVGIGKQIYEDSATSMDYSVSFASTTAAVLGAASSRILGMESVKSVSDLLSAYSRVGLYESRRAFIWRELGTSARYAGRTLGIASIVVEAHSLGEAFERCGCKDVE